MLRLDASYTLAKKIISYNHFLLSLNVYVFDVFSGFPLILGMSKGIIAVSIDTKPMRTCVAAEDMCLKRGMSLWLHPFLLVAHERKGAHASR
jgi:hypothetical protein